MPCRMIDGCLTNSKSGDFDWRCWSACTSTYYTGPCSDPINADQGTPFSYRFPKDITSVFSLVFSIIMCILSLWVSSLFEGNRELSCVSGTREEARDPRISSPLACSLACYRAPRLACHSKWRACSQDFVFLAFFAVHFQWHSWGECVTCWWLLFFLRL